MPVRTPSCWITSAGLVGALTRTASSAGATSAGATSTGATPTAPERSL